MDVHVKDSNLDAESGLPDNFLVVGYTCQDHLLVDLDRADLFIVEKVARLIMKEWLVLGSCLVVESSSMHHHLIYDRRLSWDWLVRIVQTLADLRIVERNYAQVRTFRRDLTLRISDKPGIDRYRPVPRPLKVITNPLFPEADYGIKNYLQALEAFNNDIKDWLAHAGVV